jgi:uncharacterized protein involved in exopolysaccharide biosynthesis
MGQGRLLSTGLRVEILCRDRGGGRVNNTVMNNIVKYTPPAEDGAFVSIADTARSARRRLWIVILVPLLTVSLAVGVSLLQHPVYDATAKVVVSPRGQQDNLSNTISGLQVLAIEMEAGG